VAWAYSRFGLTERVIFVGRPSEVNAESLWAIADSRRIESVGWLSEVEDVEGHLGEPAMVWEALSKLRPDTVIICGALPPNEFQSVIEAATVARCRLLAVSLYRDMTSLTPRQVSEFGAEFLELTFPALTSGQLMMKRAVDILASGLGLIALSPVLLVIAVMIKIGSAGPVLFRQERAGFGGHIFRMLKFRTMRLGADQEKASLAHLNGTGDPRLFKIRDDPRVTRVGAILRRWSLDELPQFINVFRGEMSLVGPRPFFPEDLKEYQDHHFLRLAARPGITGLWQVRGRSDISDFEEVVALDREYIDTWSPRLDLKILALTLPAVLRRRGAY
jgi:exopolysaccharide biosynthesis polyprenyl glycosylphosphotransferase